MNIAFFGSSILSAYWNGAATYYRGIVRALNRMGHIITFYEPDAFDRAEHALQFRLAHRERVDVDAHASPRRLLYPAWF